MRLIVGLGNPGPQYLRTPHNAGWIAIDSLADRHNGNWQVERRFEAETCDVMIHGKKVTLMKPLTYMNLSGQSVQAWVKKNGGEPEEIVALSDDVHLPLGRIRIRAEGSHGGQKGLLSIINCLGSLQFPRVRIGIKPANREITDLSRYVLSNLKADDNTLFLEGCETAAEAVEAILQKDLVNAMNRYNGKG